MTRLGMVPGGIGTPESGREYLRFGDVSLLLIIATIIQNQIDHIRF